MSSLHTALRRISNTTNLSDKESLVQEAYNRYLTEFFMVNAERHYRCDAYFDIDKTDQHKKSYAFFCEYKADLNLEDSRVKAGVVAQAVVYYHKFKNDPAHRLPSSLVVADINEAFVLPTYLFDELKIEGVDLDSLTPSSAGACEPLVNAILDNKSICKYTDIVLKTQDDPDAALVMVRKIEAFGQDKTGKITITQNNIAKCFNVWQEKIVRDKELTANESVAVFLDAIRYPERRMSNDKMLCVYPHKPVKVNGRFVEAFFNMFEVLPDEKKLSEFSRYYDTMVKEDDRRRKGFFITPKLWVDLAHKYVAKKLGEGWESNPKNVVWDCCAGTKALTRDYWFGNLWVSTLEQGELDASSELSTEARKTFKFDFLNQGYEELPFELRQELESIKADPEKKLVFFVNPPYGTAGDYAAGNKDKVKTGSKDTTTNKEMLQCDFGLPCREVFCQFLFRMSKFAEEVGLNEGQIIIATFNNPTWMSGNSFKKFRRWVGVRVRFNSGFIFESSEFEGCSGGWPIAFTILENISAKDEKFIHDCYESDELGLEAELIGTKEFFSTDTDFRMDDWARVPKVNARKVKSWTATALAPTNKDITLTDGFIGVCVSTGGVINNKFCCLTTVPYGDPKTFQFTAANFDKACCVYACRNLIANTWMNTKDNYFAPNEQHPLFDTFVRDAIVYSIFSYQTSVAGDIDGEHYDYINSFCPFTKKEVLELRGEHVPSMMPDESRFIRSSGKLDNLTPEAQLVLDLYKEAIKAVAPELDEFDYQHPELQLSRWDAGWRQYRDLIKEKAPEANQKLRDAIKALGNKLRPLVYELGFLRK